MRQFEDDFEDDDEDLGLSSADASQAEPVDSIAGPKTTADAVRQKILDIRNPQDAAAASPATAATMGQPQYGIDPEAERRAADSRLLTGLGRSVNAIASGSGYKADNSGYDAIDKESEKGLDRAALVKKAIAQSQFKAQQLKDLNNYRNDRLHIEQQKADAIKGSRAEARGTKAGDKVEKSYSHAVDMLNTARGDQATQQAEKDLYASAKLNKLFSKYGDLDKLSPNMANLAIIEVTKMASGAAPDDHMLHLLSPDTYKGKLAELWQKVSNDQSPANAGAFLKEYKDYADGMADDAKKQITDRYGRIIDSHAGDVGDERAQKLRDIYINRFKNQETPPAPQFPMQVKNKSGQIATVSNAAELAEAKSEGFE